MVNSDQTLKWIKLISITGGAQIIAQLLGLVSGIIVIRMLPTHEYGLYTLANTMLGTMLVLADGGISSGVMSQGGKVWQDRERLGIVLATGMDLRMKFAIGSLLFAVPFLLYLLIHHNSSWLMSFLIIFSLIPSFFTSLSGALLQVAPKLNQDIGPLQKNYIISNVLRLFLITITLFSFPWAFIAIFVAGLAQLWANSNLKKISFGYANWKQKPDIVVRKEILFFVKRILPGSVYYCLSGQITIWLISFFGNTAAVAQIGALGRLGMLLGIFTAILSTLIIPRFSRLPNQKSKLFKTFFLIQLSLFALGIFIIAIVYLFPSQILWILGKEYSNLKTELILSISGSCLGLVAGSAFALSTSRGWAINPLISIPLTLAAIIVGIWIIDISNLIGVLKFNLFVYFVEVAMYYLYCIVKIRKVEFALN